MDKVKCELCGVYFKGLAGHLKIKHSISTLDYKNKFPNSLTLSEDFYKRIKLNNEDNVRKCQNCDNTFNFSKNKKKKFCSSECMYKSISSNRIGIKTSKNYILQKCGFCGIEKETLSYNDNKYFCNNECYKNFHKVDKIEVKCKYNECSNIIRNSLKEDKKYCSRECYKLDYNEDRESFNTNSNYKKGYYISMRDNMKKWFDSFYELSRMKQLDMDDNVKEWSKNRIKIKYIGEDQKEHIYTPDLLVKYNNGIEVVEEIKGRMTTTDILKMEAAIPFLEKMNIQYKIVQKNDIYDDYIEPIIEDYENKFGTFQRISLLYSFMKMTKNISNRSTCIRRQVGCLIVPSNLENISSIGYNGSLPGEENGCKGIGSGKCGCIHAEINALNKLTDFNDKSDLILLCTLSPCLNCSKEILNYPIKRVIYLNSYRDTYGIKFLRENGIEVMNYSELVEVSNSKYRDIKIDKIIKDV
jgi:dCMP deaminase